MDMAKYSSTYIPEKSNPGLGLWHKHHRNMRHDFRQDVRHDARRAPTESGGIGASAVRQR